MLWRCGLLEDLSVLAVAAVVAAPGAFLGPLDAPFAGSFKAGDAAAPPGLDGPGAPATDSPCPTEAMALILSLGRVLVEPME